MKKLLGLLAMAPMAVAACGGSADGSLDGEINVYTRDTSSGTREGFFAAIEADDAKRANSYLVTGVSETTGNGDMINKIKNDTHGIGYISLTSLDNSGLKGLQFEGKDATEENVLDSSYGMARDFGYTMIDPAGTSDEAKLVNEFNKFLNSTNGENALISAGVIVAKDANAVAYDADATVCGGTATDIEIGGSTSVESAAKALSSALATACAAFNPVHNHTGSGDSEAVGDSTSATTMHIGFSSSGTRDGWEQSNKSGVLGQDAIVAVVHEDNPLDNLTETQLQEIFVKHDAEHEGSPVAANTKNVTKWSELS